MKGGEAEIPYAQYLCVETCLRIRLSNQEKGDVRKCQN